jgi:hypothetical protein
MRAAWIGLALVGLAGPVWSYSAPPPHRDQAVQDSCTGPAYRQFDFFVGDWDTYDVGSPDSVVARNRVGLILGGCVVHEVYDQNDGVRGESFSIYDASRDRWHQTWVTNRGTLLLLDGKLEDGRMVLTGTEPGADGTSALLRGTWYVEGTAVRETAERSRDGGRTWEPVFDIVFRPHRAKRRPPAA